MAPKDFRERFFSEMATTVRQAGFLAREMQGKVGNTKKEDYEAMERNEAETKLVAAKTMIDEIVQEMILIDILDKFPSEKIELSIDAEEETPLKQSFILNSDDPERSSVVIDPIDGTLEYTENLDSFANIICLMHKNKMDLALAYFPRRDHFYCIAPDGKSYFCKDLSVNGLANLEEFKVAENSTNQIVYINSRVPQNIRRKLVSAGFEVIEFTYKTSKWNSLDALLQISPGEVTAVLLDKFNIRDQVIGGIIANSKNGAAFDWSGNVLKWPQQGRAAQTLFCGKDRSEEIIKALKE